MPRLPSTLLVVGLLLLAGCTGGPPAGTTTTATPPETSTTTQTDPTSTTPSIDESQVVAFEELTTEQQAAFRDALDGAVSFVPNSSYVDDSAGLPADQADPFRTHSYVRYEGERYRITLDYGAGDLYASYGIRASPSGTSDDADVTNFTTIPADLQDEVRTALTEGDYYAPAGKWDSLPQPLGDTEYIRYENETYHMEYVVGDQWATVMTVEKAE